jgi:cytoskeletal protein CcmA (bactofilin family)
MEARRKTVAALLLVCAALLGASVPAGGRMALGHDLGAGITSLVPLFETINIEPGGAMVVDPDDDGKPFTEESFAKSGDILIAPGDTLRNDLYQWGQVLGVEGTLDGDVICWVQSARIAGTVTEDVNVFAQDVTISGVVGDDLRAGCQSLSIDGRVGGDVLAGAATISVSDRSVIGGDVRVGCGVAAVNGTVNGNLSLYGGQITLNGTVLGDATIVSDGGIEFGESARIAGDLSYKAPAAIDIPAGVVAGQVTFVERQEEAELQKLEKGLEDLAVAFHIYLFLAAIVAGCIIVALTKDHANRTAAVLRRKPLKSLAIGFIAFICVPIVVIITLVLILTIPLSMVLTLGYAIVAYIAKFYVAIWLGSIIVRRKEGETRSLIPVMLLGLAILYILTALPFVGTLISFLIVFFGFGALLQRKETRLDQVFEQKSEPNGALPGTFPAPPAAPSAPAGA